MICTSYGTSRTVNFWNLVPSKKIIYHRGIFPVSFPDLSSGFICGGYARGEDSKWRIE